MEKVILRKGKIVIINSVCGVGSTGRIVKDLYDAYAKQGYNTKVIYGRGAAVGVPEDDALKFNSKLDVYMHAIAARLFDEHGLKSISATKKVISFLKEFKPDIVHLHNIHGYYLNYKLLFEYLNSSTIKIVWTLHDCWAFTGHCTHYTVNQCIKWQTECKECPNIRAYPSSWRVDKSQEHYRVKKKLFVNKNTTLVTPSEWLKNEVEKSFLHGMPVCVINNGIDVDIFKPRSSNLRKKYNIDNNKKIVLGVANYWNKSKGYDSFIRLSRILPRDYVIVLVGLNKKQLQKLPENIVGITLTQNKAELAEFYSMADVFFNPTVQDTYPTVNIESLCCGTPVVCFSGTGGGTEIVGDNGIIIDDRSSASVLNAIEKCKDIKVDIESQHRKYSKSTYCDKYIALIKSILGGER